MEEKREATQLSLLRRIGVEFLISSSLQLRVSPLVKYTSLSLFAERFFPSLTNPITTTNNRLTLQDSDSRNWLLQPLRECNLQLFALVSIWISSKIHESSPLSVKSLKALGDDLITEQHFTTRDFLEAEVVFMQVFRFEIGTSSIAFTFLEELIVQFRELARVGKLLKFEACMDIMDLLYESEGTSLLYCSPRFLAAAILVASYVITVPKQTWEFPVLPWVKFVTSYEEKDIGELVKVILEHVLLEQPTTHRHAEIIHSWSNQT